MILAAAIAAVVVAGIGVSRRSRMLLVLAACLTLPFVLYLSWLPNVRSLAWLLPLPLLAAAWLVRARIVAAVWLVALFSVAFVGAEALIYGAFR